VGRALLQRPTACRKSVSAEKIFSNPMASASRADKRGVLLSGLAVIFLTNGRDVSPTHRSGTTVIPCPHLTTIRDP